ncbi:hypothetical protein [Nocardia carnea]|uniref:hypothetical protein n=1 Tax=Nocardia carnea TaxID=37328 RepID=UPI000310A1AF|nr:hypothetical protein [Nocardia carnea]
MNSKHLFKLRHFGWPPLNEAVAFSREKVYDLGDYGDERMLRGFTRPFRRLTEALQSEGVIPDGVAPIFVARYPDGVKATYFSVPSEVPVLLEELASSSPSGTGGVIVTDN